MYPSLAAKHTNCSSPRIKYSPLSTPCHCVSHNAQGVLWSWFPFRSISSLTATRWCCITGNHILTVDSVIFRSTFSTRDNMGLRYPPVCQVRARIVRQHRRNALFCVLRRVHRRVLPTCVIHHIRAKRSQHLLFGAQFPDECPACPVGHTTKVCQTGPCSPEYIQDSIPHAIPQSHLTPAPTGSPTPLIDVNSRLATISAPVFPLLRNCGGKYFTVLTCRAPSDLPEPVQATMIWAAAIYYT